MWNGIGMQIDGKNNIMDRAQILGQRKWKKVKLWSERRVDKISSFLTLYKYFTRSHIDYTWWQVAKVKVDADDFKSEISNRGSGVAEKLSKKQIENEFGNVNIFHRDVKPNILKVAKQVNPKIGKGKDVNFDILMDTDGKIFLQVTSLIRFMKLI